MSALPNDLQPNQGSCLLDSVPVLADPEVVNLAPFPFAITDLETGEFLFINELVCKLFKIDCNAKQNLNISSLYCDLGFRARVVEQILKDGVVRDVEVPLKRTDGQIVWAVGSARLVRYRDRLCALIAVVDITQLKRLTEDLERTQQELREALAVKQRLQEAAERDSRAKSTLLVNLSHEIRTPLNGLMGMAQMLAEETVEPGLKTLAESICKAAKSLHAVATEIIEHSELETGVSQPHRSEIDPIQAICEAVRAVGPALEDKPVELATLCSCDVPSKVQLDGERFVQALSHVLGNAAKFTERGSIVVRCDYGLDCLTVSVADTGIGIPSDRLDEVFHDFLQIDGSSTRRYGGIGLGLSIAKKAVESLGGEIYASSEEGAGSTFTLVVPAPPAAPPRMPARIPEGRTACVISDSDAMAQMLEAVCRYRGYEPRRLTLGDWGGRADPSDELVVLDVPNDPETARSALARLRALPERVRKGAVCLIHGAALPEASPATELGDVRFISKPTDPLRLCDALNCCETWNTPLGEERMESSDAFTGWEFADAKTSHLPLADSIERDWSNFDEEFIRRVAGLLEETTETCVEGMRLGIEREDTVLLAANAYCLHGSALNAGATAAAKLCRRIFELAHQKDFGGAASLLPRVRDEVAAFQAAVDRQLGRKEA